MRGAAQANTPLRSHAFEKAALFVFLARPARTRVVTPDLCPGQHAGLTGRGSTVGAVDLAPPGLPDCGRRGAGRGGKIRAADPDLEELLEHDLLQVVHHLLEHVEGFLL